MRKRSLGALLAVPAWIWLLFFFVVPVGLIVYYSFGYKPGLFGTHANDKMSLDRYAEVLTPTFFATFQNTLLDRAARHALCPHHRVAVGATGWRSRLSPRARPARSPSARAVLDATSWSAPIGWQIILSADGWISDVLEGAGPRAARRCSYTRGAVLLGVVYNYLPLMVLPCTSRSSGAPACARRRKDLGAGRWRPSAR